MDRNVVLTFDIMLQSKLIILYNKKVYILHMIHSEIKNVGYIGHKNKHRQDLNIDGYDQQTLNVA